MVSCASCVFLQELFENVNKAYEFLCGQAKITEGPNPQNIVLILKAQSILFSRYRDGGLYRSVRMGFPCS